MPASSAPLLSTITLDRRVSAPLAAVWDAYADPSKRSRWSVPAGEVMVYDEADFREAGRDRYRCGPPEKLDFHGVVEYSRIIPRTLIVYTETVRSEPHVLATGVLAWEFEAHGDETQIKITDQLISFIGQSMIDGSRNGHTKALDQLDEFLKGASNGSDSER